MSEQRESAASSPDGRPESARVDVSEALRAIDAINGRYLKEGTLPGPDDLIALRRWQAILPSASGEHAQVSRDGWNVLVRLYDVGGAREDVLEAGMRAVRGGLESPELVVRLLSASIEAHGPRETLACVREHSLDRIDAPGVQATIAKTEYEVGEYFLAASRARRALEGSPDTSTATGILILALIGLDEIGQAAGTVLDHPDYGLDCSWAIMALLDRLHATPELAHLIEPVGERFLERCPVDRDLWEVRILRRTGRDERAEELLRARLRESPDDERWQIEFLQLQVDAFDWYANAERFERMLERPDLPANLRRRTESAVRYAALVRPREEAGAPEGEPFDHRFPDSLFEHVLRHHRNATYAPVPGRIALLGATLGPGGAERVLGVTYQGLVEAGADVGLWLYSLDPERSDDFYLRELGIRRDQVCVLSSPSEVPEPFAWLPYGHGANAYRAYLKILEERPEVVHGWQDGINVELVFAAVVAGVEKIVLHPHNMQPDLVHRTTIAGCFRRVYKAAMERPEVRMVFVSDASRKDYLRWIGRADEGRTSVVYNGFDLVPIDAEVKRSKGVAQRMTFGIPEDRFLVGAAFRFAEIKRPLLWIEVARAVLERVPNAHFVVFGDGQLKSAVEARIERWGIADRFTLPGRVSDVPDKLAMLDAYLLTSASEGLPTVLIEAQFAGVPVVASPGGGTAECFVDDETGHLVASDEVDDYATGLVRVRDDPASAERAAATREAFLKGRFGKRRMIDSLLDVYGLPERSRAPTTPEAVPEGEPLRYLVAMPWGRVGSNLLVSILEQLGPSRGANETFNEIRDAQGQLDWLAEFYDARPGEAVGHAIFCKQSLYSMVDPEAVEIFCRDRGIRVIRMTRDDHLKAAVSQMRAQQYAELTRREEGRARWGVRRDARPLGPTRLDAEKLIEVISIMRRSQGELLASFERCDVADVEYEQLNGDLGAAVRRIADFLDMTLRPYEVPFRKATANDLSTVVLNHDEIVAAVAALDAGEPSTGRMAA